MNLFRNTEIKKTFIFFGVASLVGTVGAFFVNVLSGIITLSLCLMLFIILYIATLKRYKHIAALSHDIDVILHSEAAVSLEKYKEGELSLLHNEIQKMITRLLEQKTALTNEKKLLADSIADISHQIRTPLTSLNLVRTFLSSPDISEDRKQELLCELGDLLSRIERLIDTLLKMSKIDAGTIKLKKENLSLNSLISKSCETLLVPIDLREQNLSVTTDGNVFCDLFWTAEAITNIIKNCMEHTPNGGTISVSAKETLLYSEIIISDNGSGIDKDDLPHIFERFYKGKNSSEKSVGIGLAFARMIISSQDGTVKASNAQNGAVFTIRFYKSVL